ncbi:MAG: glycosyltransferase [Archangium sp.]|nr:glycosyltransferase [Archangium sp.]
MKVTVVWPAPAAEASAVGPASGGYLYDAQLVHALRRLVDVHVVSLRGALEVKALAGSSAVLVDGLAAPLVVDALASLRAWRVGLVHMTPRRDEVQQRFFDALDAVVFVSESVRTETAAVVHLPPRVTVAVPGIDHIARPVRTPRAEILGVGHLLPHKGVLEALEVFAALHRRAPHRSWRATWLGGLDRDVPYAESVVARRAALGLEARVEFAGHVPLTQVVTSLASCAALVSTSYTEAWGLAAAEALACGVPLVSWTRGGVFPLAAAEGAGRFVARDDVEAMAHALEVMLTDSVERQRCEVAAARVARQLSSWDACARAVVTACG